MRLGQVGRRRSVHDRALAEVVLDRARGPLGVLHPAEHDDHLVALGGAQRVDARGPGRSPYVVEQGGRGGRGRRRAEHHDHLAVAAPAERAGAGEHGGVRVRAEHRVDDQGLEAGVPGAADLRGPGIDLGGRERQLAAVAQQPVVHGAGQLLAEQLVDVLLDDVDGQPDQLDGLLEVDHPGQRPGGGPEHLGGDRRVGVGGHVRESPWSRYHVTNPWIPAWTIIPTQERSSAERSVNQTLSDSIRVIAAVLSVPTSRSSWSEASSRSAEGVDTLRG